jgi:hypothetical protein
VRLKGVCYNIIFINNNIKIKIGFLLLFKKMIFKYCLGAEKMWKIVDLAGFAYYINKTVVIYKYKNLLDNRILFIVEENEFLYNPDIYIISDIDKIEKLIDILKNKDCKIIFNRINGRYQMIGCKFYEIMNDNDTSHNRRDLVLKTFRNIHPFNEPIIDIDINNIQTKTYDEYFDLYNSVGFPTV